MDNKIKEKRNREIFRRKNKGQSVAYLSAYYRLSPPAIYRVLDRFKKKEYNGSINK